MDHATLNLAVAIIRASGKTEAEDVFLAATKSLFHLDTLDVWQVLHARSNGQDSPGVTAAELVVALLTKLDSNARDIVLNWAGDVCAAVAKEMSACAQEASSAQPSNIPDIPSGVYCTEVDKSEPIKPTDNVAPLACMGGVVRFGPPLQGGVHNFGAGSSADSGSGVVRPSYPVVRQLKGRTYRPDDGFKPPVLFIDYDNSSIGTAEEAAGERAASEALRDLARNFDVPVALPSAPCIE